MVATLSRSVDAAPVCMRYAGIIPAKLVMDGEEVCALQPVSVEIWHCRVS